jgi:hypothetical protein
MNEEQIQELLSVEKGSKKISSLCPNILLDRLTSAYRKKVGAVREYGLTTSALFYFAARGVLDWEQQHEQRQRGKKSGGQAMAGN